MSVTSVKKAIAEALKDPKGRIQVSKAEAQAIAKAAIEGKGTAAKVSASEAKLIGKVLSQDAFESGQSYTLTAPARAVLESFAAAEHLPYGANAGAMASQIEGQLQGNALPAKLAKAPSTSSLLPLPLSASADGTAREAYVNPNAQSYYLKLGVGTKASWYGPLSLNTPAPGADLATLKAQLATAAQGLDYMSESDYPFDVVAFPGAGTKKPTGADLLKALGLPSDTPVESRTMNDFFNPLTDPEDTSDDFMMKQAPMYADLRATLEDNLTDLQVFRTGSIQIGVYIVGRNASGDLVGVHTTSIET